MAAQQVVNFRARSADRSHSIRGKEKFHAEVGTIYTLVATSHLQSLATAIGTPNRELSNASVSTYSAAMFLTSHRTRY